MHIFSTLWTTIWVPLRLPKMTGTNEVAPNISQASLGIYLQNAVPAMTSLDRCHWSIASRSHRLSVISLFVIGPASFQWFLDSSFVK